MTLAARYSAGLTHLLGGTTPPLIGVAVSGGGDSMAALALTCAWAEGRARITALTVDHGLRPESGAEAEWVAARAAELGADHVTLRWQGWDGQGNLQAEARNARYRLLADWAKGQGASGGLPPVILGHTRDDQAETLLMRLSRGSGVDGLSGMARRHLPQQGGPLFLRPLLDEMRKDLRDWLRAEGVEWLDDPSNDDSRFLRVQMRQALETLASLGLTAERLTGTATQMARARKALAARMAEVAARIVDEPLPGILRIGRKGFAATERETQLRLLAHGIGVLTGAPYRPRLATLEGALDAGLAGSGSTLAGVQLLVAGDHLLMVRELAAVLDAEIAADGSGFWDRRWRVQGARLEGCTIRALGAEGASRIDRPDGLPHAALTSYPGIFSGPTLVAAPHLWHAALCRADYNPAARFHPSQIAH